MKKKGFAAVPVALTSHEAPFGVRGRQWLGCLVRCCLPFTAFIFLAVAAGCVVIPTPEHSLLEGRGKIEESDMAFLAVGSTTREDILLRFGEPDLVLQDQRILIYHWSVSHGYWFAGGGYSGAGGPIAKGYIFMLEFDEKGRLKRFERSGSIWTSEKSQIEKWAPPAGRELPGPMAMNIYIDPIPVNYVKSVPFDSEFQPTRFGVGEFSDNRASPHSGTVVGQVKGRFNLDIGGIQTCKPAALMVQTAVIDQLEGLGHKLAGKHADVVISGKVSEFAVTTSSDYPDYAVSGVLDVFIEVRSAAGHDRKGTRHYKAEARQTLKVFVEFDYPEIKAKAEQVVRDCLEEMQRQMASDAELKRMLRG